MANILASLGVAASNLGVFGQALSVAQNNVGNATTPGYARQRVNLVALPFLVRGGQSGGVALASVQSLRDRFLDLGVIEATQGNSYFQALSQILSRIEPNFQLSGSLSISATLDQLFNSFSALSTSPNDFNNRQQVLQSAQTLASTIRTTYAGLTSERSALDQQAQTVVAQINTLTGEIAKLNASRQQGGVAGDTSALDTRLSQALQSLAGLVDYQSVEQEDGSTTLILRNGAALVAGTSSYSLHAAVSASGIVIQDSFGNDATAGVQGGQMGAILAARNTNISNYLNQLNELAGALADTINRQLAQGHDLAGLAGKPLFQYTSLAHTGAGRTAGITGAATPAPPDSVTLNFSGGVTGSITADLNSFFVASAPPAGLATGDTITVKFTSADGAIQTSITTAPLTAGDTAATIATRLNDQIALDPALAGKFTFSDQGGNLKLVETDTAGQGYTFTASTSDPGFTSGLESGGRLGGESAPEIAAALNAQVAANSALTAAGVRFTATGGQVRVDAGVSFTANVTDSSSGTGFVSGLAGTFTAGGSPAAATFAVTSLGNGEIAASGPNSSNGNENALALAQLGSSPLIGGFTAGQFYGNLVAQAGGDASQAQTSSDTQKQILAQAQNLRDSYSGVSLDEEATQLTEFQKAYEASARVITVLDSLVSTVISLIGTG